jgi:hypothetical protein
MPTGSHPTARLDHGGSKMRPAQIEGEHGRARRKG